MKQSTFHIMNESEGLGFRLTKTINYLNSLEQANTYETQEEARIRYINHMIPNNTTHVIDNTAKHKEIADDAVKAYKNNKEKIKSDAVSEYKKNKQKLKDAENVGIAKGVGGVAATAGGLGALYGLGKLIFT
jgi:uncharacterized protein YdcH (DUF465 family)